jgi:hypothetical protein
MDKKKSINSNLLMGIGIFLIFIAGCVFVTNAWNYMSDPAKQICLMLTMAGLFYGSHKVKAKLDITGSALYYLGTATAGFLAYSVLKNSVFNNFEFWDRVTCALCIGTVLIGCKIVMDRNKFDVILEYALVMSISVSTCALTIFYGDFNIMLTMWAAVLMVINYFYKNHDKFGIEGLGSVVTVIQKIQIIAILLGIVHFISEVIPDNSIVYFIKGILDVVGASMITLGISVSGEVSFMVVPFMILSIFTATELEYKSVNNKLLKLLNSASICLLIYTMLFDINRFLSIDSEIITVAALAIVGVVGFFVNRKELTVFVLILSMLNTYNIILDMNYSAYQFAPYAIIAGVYMLGMYYKNKNKKLLRFAIYQFILQGMTAIMIIGKLNAHINNTELMIISKMYAIATMTILCHALLICASFIKDREGRKIIYTMSLAFGIFLVNMFPGAIFTIPAYFGIEYFVATIMVSIVILRVIWYDEKNIMGIIQDIALFISLTILLIHNVFGEQHLVCALIYAVFYTLTFLYGVIASRKVCWISSLCYMFIHFVYITREFWTSVPWWGYLFAVGIIFVLIAVFLEKKETVESIVNEKQAGFIAREVPSGYVANEIALGYMENKENENASDNVEVTEMKMNDNSEE